MTKREESWREIKAYLEYCFGNVPYCNAIKYNSTENYLKPFIDVIENELKRLEQINNSHLVAIPRKSGKSSLATEVIWYRYIAEEREKVLKIIKEKKVNVNQFLKHCSQKSKWGYNKTICDKERQLTQEEYDLLKGYIKEDTL